MEDDLADKFIVATRFWAVLINDASFSPHKSAIGAKFVVYGGSCNQGALPRVRIVLHAPHVR